jgi:hypothetical protein
MKTVDTLEHHNVHKFTLSGFAFGSLLILISIAYIYKFEDLGFRFLVMYITLVPGIMFILRSLRPPIGFIRGVMTYVGGTLIGAVPLLVTSNNNQLLWLGLIFGVLASALLGGSFTEKQKKAECKHP